MTDTTVDERHHIADLVSKERPIGSFAWVARNLSAALSGNSDNDPIRNGTVEL